MLNVSQTWTVSEFILHGNDFEGTFPAVVVHRLGHVK